MKCSLLTLHVRHWLQDGRQTRLLNLFDDVCNLVDDIGNVFSLVSPKVGAGPFSMVIEGEFTALIDAEPLISIVPNIQLLRIGSLTIETNQAVLWDPKPPWSSLEKSWLLDEPAPRHVNPDIESLLQQVLHGIANNDFADVRIGAYRLAGLGNGLTPSGDDLLMGIIYGLWVWRPDKELMHLIVETAVPRTTTLSAAFLKAAAEGEATIHWHNLINEHSDAVNQILAIGDSSGRDAWTGFIRLGNCLKL